MLLLVPMELITLLDYVLVVLLQQEFSKYILLPIILVKAALLDKFTMKVHVLLALIILLSIPMELNVNVQLQVISGYL